MTEVHGLKEQPEGLYSGVLNGETESKVGAVANQIINTRARLIEAELKIREQVELEQRITELESLLETREGQSGWG